MDDLVAVMDAVGSKEATFVAQGHAAQMALMAAASHPERARALVLVNGFARLARADDYAPGMPPRIQEVYGAEIEAHWGDGTIARLLGPSIAERPGVVEWWGRVERYGATPIRARSRLDSILDLDVRHVLPVVDVPTLIIHNRDNELVRVGHGRYLAENIRGARLLERASADHWPLPEPDLIGAIEEFVGDRSWRVMLDRFEETSRKALALHGGHLTDTAGDGIVATFDGPARAIRGAWRLRDELRRSGLEVRAGIHAGEIVRRSDGIAGIAVHIAARVSDLAGAREVLTTRTVRDLVAGSGIAFEERGEHELKGVPDRWALYAAVG
jgi:Adenylate and Guanylate cyclase catalytic domain